MKPGERVRRHSIEGRIIDCHPDKEHVSVLPDGARTLVRWRIPEIELLQ